MKKIFYSGFVAFAVFVNIFILQNNIFAKDEQNCSECHAQKYMRKYNDDGKLTELFTDKEMFNRSIHAKLTCQTCHASVKITPHKTEEIEKVDCSAECHIDDTTISKDYRHKAQYDTVYRSVHGASFEEKNVCGCHDPHRMTKAGELSLNEVIKVCLKCHDDRQMMVKHKVKMKPQESYANSLHGEMLKFGDTNAPTCISCHDYHDTRRQDDPKSAINSNNLLKMCKQEICHPNAKPAFSQGSIHFIYRGNRKKIINWVEKFLFYLLLFTVSGMLIHYVLDFLGKSSERRKSFSVLINLGLILFLGISGAGYYYFNFNKKDINKFDTFNISAEYRSICLTCHGEIVHKKKKSIRAFMNRHAQKVICETCHLKKKDLVEKEKLLDAKGDSTLVYQEKNDITYRWYDGNGSILAGLRGNEGDDKSKIAPYIQTGKDIVFIVSDKEGKIPKDFSLSKRGRECSECHRKEGSIIDFKALGYSDARIKKIEELNVYKRMREGEKFFQQELF